MTARLKLPNRRPQTTFVVTHEGQAYSVSVGQAEAGGTPAEVFVQARRTSSTVEALARDAAILASFALQYGAPAIAMQQAMTREENGSPASLVGAVFDGILANFPAPEATP